ncbi:zinc finger protein [Forsythia ovata]|uniref:Zinc finger protein n=1 Tax=Forsythia ovata TaxID=205694 RepID=A0ABD1SJA4_9LAMI
MLIGESMQLSSAESTIIRMPLSSKFMEDEIETGLKKMGMIYNKFMEHASRTILFLKGRVILATQNGQEEPGRLTASQVKMADWPFQVSLSTWEHGSPQSSLEFSIDIDPSHAVVRNPFSEKKWKKFQISSLFSSSSAAIKLQVLDLNLYQGGARFVDRWLIVLSMGSGQTRNMALDSRYLAYKLTPVAGVAAQISQNGRPSTTHLLSSIMSPLPLSSCINIPVTVLGYFLVRHNLGRFLFKFQDSETALEVQSDAASRLIEAWNRELMSCVRDSYIKLILEMQKLRKEPLTSVFEPNLGRSISDMLTAYGSEIYSFWPRSTGNSALKQPEYGKDSISMKSLKADWECLIEQVIRPFYARLIDLPVWQLYSGNLVKATDGMFLSQPGSGVGESLLPATVCAFVKEHYPVFSVPWELVTEIQAVGVTVREIKPKMVRDLLRVSSMSIVLRSVDIYVDVLEYCLSDLQPLEPSGSSGLHTSRDLSSSDFSTAGKQEESYPFAVSIPNRGRHGMSAPMPTNSGGDAIEMVASLGKAIFDFGRGVVEDIGRPGGSTSQRYRVTGSSSDGLGTSEDRKLLSIASEIKGLPCPTATSCLIKLGFNDVWVGNKEQQTLMISLAGKFIHTKVMERSVLVNIFSNSSLQSFLKLQSFSFRLLSSNMRLLFHENWVNHVIDSNNAPWFSWEKIASPTSEWPSPEWIGLFWKIFSDSWEDISMFSEWPLIPAFLGRPILCRVRERHLVFVPPPFSYLSSSIAPSEVGAFESNQSEFSSESDVVQSYLLSFRFIEKQYPWLLSLLNQCNIPIYDTTFMDCAAPSKCLPTTGLSLGRIIASKLVAAKQAGYFPELNSFLPSDRDELFNLFAFDFSSCGSEYGGQELEVLRDLPIYRTALGTYTRLQSQDLCMISSNTFLKPFDDRCLSYSADSTESSLLRALGIPECADQQILVKFGLPGFEGKPQPEQEDILIYLYTNWQELQQDSSIIEALKETSFVKTAEEQSVDMCKPKDLYDPGDALLTSVFSGVRKKFPGERFISDEWLRILRKVGLRTSAEADIVLECAKRVEYLGGECIKPMGVLDELETDIMNMPNEVSFEVWLLAENLVKAIFSNFAGLYSNNFCNLLGKIACIPAEIGFPSLGGKRSGKRMLCSYSEAIVSKDWPLAWSCAPILSRQSVVPPDYAWGPLHLRSPPAFSTVLKHLQVIGRNGGEDTLAHWPTASGLMTIDIASLEVLKYLDKVWGSLSSADIAGLQQVAFLPAANCTRLVTASSLFTRLTINLSPFAFELPSVYLPFVKILKDLGLQDSLSVASAKNLLSDLQKACGYQRLNPNEFRAVNEILFFICDEENSSDISSWESEAIVPDDGCRLVHAKSCVYIDSHSSHYVKYIDTSRLRFVHQDLPERISLALGIRKLSDVVIEELDHGEDLLTLECIGSISLASIRHRLLSESFQAAVWRVLASVASDIPGFRIPDLENVRKSLTFAAETLKFVKFLHTCFLLLPKSLNITQVAKKSTLPEWEDISHSQHRALYYINKLKTCVLIAEPPSYMSVLDVIAIVLSRILDSPVPLPIGSMFLCPDETESAVFDVLKLCSHKRDAKFGCGIESLLGKDILPQDATRVQFHPLRPFYRGEIVAWRSQNGEKLKYGRVPENVRSSAGQALYRFMVETSSGVTEPLLSSNIFSFRSVLFSDVSATMPEDDHIVTNSINAESSGGRSRPSQPVQDLQRGRVSAAELVQAVHEMLSSAGINMDVERQSLLQTTLTLQDQLESSQAALLLEQEKSEIATKEADTAKAAWSCRVCLNNEVDVTIVPCGHVLCRRCSSAVSRCPFCRIQVSKIMRIFRP